MYKAKTNSCVNKMRIGWNNRNYFGNVLENYFHLFSIRISSFIKLKKMGFMYKKVVLKAFKKGESEIPGKTTKTQVSEHISSVLFNDYKTQISGRTLRNLFNEAKDVETHMDISINSDYVKDLCKYLGYENYNAFIKDTSSQIKRKNKVVSFILKHWIILLICFITISTTLIITTFNQQRWMVWDNANYIEVGFDANKYSINQLKLYNEDRIDNFKKIIPNCDTKFFNEDGSENLWYGKNNNGELEFFTAFGRHPKSGKTLKPITDYMIRKYICDSY